MNIPRFVAGLVIALNFSFPVQGQTNQFIEAIPSGWRLQDYTDGGINLYHTGSTCSSGQMTLQSNVNSDSKQRLWSLIMSAKLSKSPVGVYYSNINGQCIIHSFYLKETG